MKAFAYINPTNEKDAVAALSAEPDKVMPIGGGQDLLARMKDYITQPDRIVNVKNALDATVTATPAGGLRIGAAVKIADLAENAQVAKMYPAIAAAASEVGTPPVGIRTKRPISLPQRGIRLLQEGRLSLLLGERREPVQRDLRRWPELHRASLEPGGAVGRLRRDVPPGRAERRA